jgi:hypothetical protein
MNALNVLLLVVVLLPCASGQAQAPAAVPRDGVITGRVVDGVSGKPVSAAIVSFGSVSARERAASQPVRILTGGDGRFVFEQLQPGSFDVTATKRGYADGASGRRRPGGSSQPVVLTATEKSADVTVRLWKNGAITGTVTDEAGEPVVGLQLRALMRSVASGRRQFAPAGPPMRTDDRGVYRFSNLLAGDYLIIASPPPVSVKANIFADIAQEGRGVGELASAFVGAAAAVSLPVGDALFALRRGGAIPPPPVGGRMQIYPPTFHPSAQLAAQASIVTLAAGEERASIDIQLLPVPTARVSGTLLASSGPVDMAPLRLVPSGAEGLPAEALAFASISDASGAFIFTAVTPGRYSLRSTTRGGAAGMAWIDMPLTVAGDDIDGVVAMMNPPLRISGRLQFEGAIAVPGAAPGRGVMTAPFVLESAEDAGVQVTAAITWEGQAFNVAGYLPGRYIARVTNSPRGWMFKAAMLNGVDVSDTPFELSRDITDLVVIFTDRWSGISGGVQGPGADAATVLAFTTDTQAWEHAGSSARRLRSTRVNAAGQFGISSLPPGDYYVIAVPEEEWADWRDPAALDILTRSATHVTILEGEHKIIDLSVRQVRR